MNSGASRIPESWAPRWGLAIAVGLVGLVVAACLAALWFVDAQGQSLIDAQERDDVSAQIDLFTSAYHDEDAAGLTRAIGRQAQLDRNGIYALRGPGGDILAGNISNWPAGIDENESWGPVKGSGRPEYHAGTRSLGGGLTLLVGSDDATRRAFQAEIIDAVWIAVAIVAITGLGVSAAVTTLIMRRVRDLSELALRVSGGDYSARAKTSGERGPFGEIARAQNAMLDRIEALVTGLRTITDSLAHDLRTPLSRTRRHVEQGLLADNLAEARVALENALAETDRTISTFTALIDISRADAGLSREAMTDTDLGAIVNDVQELFEPLAEERKIELVAQSSAASIPGHKPLLMQAVANLVQNAIKYAPDGGHVAISMQMSDETAEVIVTDDGPGIPADRRAEAVRRFHRVASPDTPAPNAPEGIGLGLAIVDACARLHSGRLVLEDNAPGLRARLMLSRR